MARIRRVTFAAILVAGVVLQIVPRDGSLAAEEPSFYDEYGSTYGWPFRAITFATDHGRDLIRASVTLEGSLLVGSTNDGDFPHRVLRVGPLILNALLVFLALSCALRVGRNESNPDDR